MTGLDCRAGLGKRTREALNEATPAPEVLGALQRQTGIWLAQGDSIGTFATHAKVEDGYS